ncbi:MULTISPECIES: hypothetical protein [Asticcacaulis]|jgi:hypothetical protein|uniref:hypothetical protein n=1 Tax=Asticcacaulis TaxID=76890 RepID=UPI001AE458C9|nr:MULTISPECIES: hypothetical protein [Asticcacaulis]MBP2160467.1 hypothetical protein [Asticcacaulis solisilvae]MDR6801512.1 hypothetical protein [Asticcacaulis sp. BE141]
MNSISKTVSATLIAAGFTALLALGACGKQESAKTEEAAVATETGAEGEHAHAPGDESHSEEAQSESSAGHEHAEGEEGAH